MFSPKSRRSPAVGTARRGMVLRVRRARALVRSDAMDVSAEALSELKLVRPSTSPLLPARPRRAREPNPTRRSVGPVRGRRFAASPRVSSPVPPRVRSDRLLPVLPIPSGAHVVPRSQGRAREAQGAAPRARLRGCAAARRRGGGGRARVCANAGGRADDRARVRVPGVPRPGVLQARVRRRVRRRRARVAAGQGSAGAGHGRGAATGRSDAAAGGGVGRGRRKPKAVGAAPKPPSPPSPHRAQAPVAGNIIVSDDSDSADIETDVDIDYSDAGTSN